MNYRLVYILTLVVLFAGCASNIDTQSPSSSSTLELKVFNDDELVGLRYKSLGEVMGLDCSPTWFRIANSKNALNKLIVEAKQLGANGVINVSCFDSGLGPVAWCNNSATCKGDAILYERD